MAHLTSEFRFEKYKTAEEAEAALLKLHPVGSSVDDLVKTLEGAGAKCSFNNNKYGNFVNCRYLEKSRLFPSQWSAGAKLDDSKKIEKIISSKYIEAP